MYIETSTGRAGDIARLVSPTISVRDICCICFFSEFKDKRKT